MEGGTVHIVTLDQKPCVVQYLDKFNKFLVGTYELFQSIEDAKLLGQDDRQLTKRLESVNYRAGKLILMRGNDVTVPSIEYEFDCQAGGGVFDIKARFNNVDNSYSIYVAHSNGTVGIYKLALHCGNKICLREHLKVEGSKMLTCIDIFDVTPTTTESSPQQKQDTSNNIVAESCSPDHTRQQRTSSFSLNHRMVVGDSEGLVTIILYPRASDHQASIREKVTNGDSIWQVKSMRLPSGKDTVIVGAENSSWFIYSLDDETKRLILLYKNSSKDFSAGVTCISLLDVFHSAEYDLVEILLGSYDETLQVYQIKLSHDGISKPGVCHMNTISIDNGGIWRVKPSKGNKKRQLCVAAMYAGSFILNLDGENTKPGKASEQLSDSTSLSRIIDTESLKLTHKPLHYDIDVSSCNRTYCIVDFNNSLCLFKTVVKS